MNWFATKPAPDVEPAIKAETCVACGDADGPMNQIDLPGYGLQWVCVEPSPCKQRAQLRGIWKGGA